MAIPAADVTRRILHRILALVPEAPRSLEFPREKWDAEYAAGQWDYLGGVSEIPRYAVVAGYVRYFNQHSRILEIGCGTGILLKYLRDVDFASYQGVDISAAAVDRAAEFSSRDDRIAFSASCGSRYRDSSTYDILVMNESLYYFDDCIAVLEHYAAQLSDDGKMIISMVVGPQSIQHWKTITTRYDIHTGVRTQSSDGRHTWTCNVLAASAVRGARR
jgi:predicted TPR repeat methyltransferase